jgi:O-antigen/teichoic acid export membrane protein
MRFFQQSGWLMISTLVGGLLMFFVHKAAKQMGDDYAVFFTLLQIVTLMGIPVIGIQMVFVQQAAAALHEEHERELAGMFRGVLRATFYIWLAMLALVFLLRNPILDGLKITSPAALWITVFIALISMWLPTVQGLLQGRQNFLWMGWASILNGIVRCAAAFVIVVWLGRHAGGGMVAILLGLMVAGFIAAWHNRDLWHIKPTPMVWRPWLARVVPLTFGLGALQFMLSADMIFVQHYFDEGTKYYGAAGMIGRALVFLTQPLAAVMFPKIVQSAARSEKSDALAIALGATAFAGAATAIGCTLFPALPLWVIYDKSFFDHASPLVPWYAWSMLPLTLAMVLANALLARSRFSVVPWLAGIAVAYSLALYWQLHFNHGTFRTVIQTLGIFSTLMLAVCAWFTWGLKIPSPKPPVQG